MNKKILSIAITVAFSGAALVGYTRCDAERKSGAVSGAEKIHEDGKHEEHGAHKKHEDEEVVRLSDEELEEFGVRTAMAGPGKLDVYLTFPGEVSVNANRSAHIVPRVSGVVREVRKNLGDHVKEGEVLAILESRELADVKAEYLTSIERLKLAETNYAREERLWRKKVSSEQDYLNAKQTLAEAHISVRSAEQKLHALGFPDTYLERLPKHLETTFNLYKITAPFDGTVIEKHITLGEMAKNDTGVFIIADLSSVWVNLSIYQKDLPFVRKGASVTITAGHGIPDTTGVLSYVGPIVGEQTRTALARAVLPNDKGELRPGLFITGKVAVNNISVHILAPKTALQTFGGKTVVFIKTDKGFEPSPVVIGRSDETNVEIVSGLSQGQKYVTKGAFTLKAQLSKSAFGEGHSH